MIIVFLNVNIKVKYGQIKAKIVHQIVLNKKHILMKIINVNQDVIQVRFGKTKNAYQFVHKLNIFKTHQTNVYQNVIFLRSGRRMVVNQYAKIFKNGILNKIIV